MSILWPRAPSASPPSTASPLPQRRPHHPREVERLREYQAQESTHGNDLFAPEISHDTVGAVALDRDGNIAASTSTGGTLNKDPGRLGDSSLIGCGCYAQQSGNHGPGRDGVWRSLIELSVLDTLEQMGAIPWRIASWPYDACLAIDVGENRRHYAPLALDLPRRTIATWLVSRNTSLAQGRSPARAN